MTQPKPHVSVLIPSYNHAAFLGEAISSVLAQTYADWELVVVDDGSSDDSFGLAESFAHQDSRVRVYRQDNQGICSTLNRLAELAQGSLWVTMGSDDALMPTRLAAAVADLIAHPECPAVFSDIIVVDEAGQTLSGRALPFTGPIDAAALTSRLLLGNCLCAASAVMRREAVLASGPLAAPYQTVQDYELWLRLLRQGQLYFNAERLVRYRWHAGNLSKRHAWLSAFEQRKALDTHAESVAHRHNIGAVAVSQMYARIFQLSLALGDHPQAARVLAKKKQLGSISEQEAIWLLQYTFLKRMRPQTESLIKSMEPHVAQFGLESQARFEEICLAIRQS